jgi:hypothetical protein
MEQISGFGELAMQFREDLLTMSGFRCRATRAGDRRAAAAALDQAFEAVSAVKQRAEEPQSYLEQA